MELIEADFENHFGQVIQPGDDVMYVGKSYGCTNINRGVYLGYNVDRISPYNRQQVKFVRVQYTVPESRYVSKETGKQCGYSKAYDTAVDLLRKDHGSYPPYDLTEKKIKSLYKEVEVQVNRVVRLQNNYVYPYSER